MPLVLLLYLSTPWSAQTLTRVKLTIGLKLGKTRSLKFRKTQIQRLYDLVRDNEERFYDALAKDMRKPRCEALSGDVAPVLEECLYFLDVWYIQSIKNIHMLIVIVLELGSLGKG